METYTFTYPVRLDDLDYMGIVGNAEWLTFLTRARIDLLEKIGFPFTEMMKQKIGVVAELKIRFIGPAYFGDQLEISILPHQPFKKGLLLNYTVKNKKNEECLTAEVKIIFVDATGKSTLMPKEIANGFFGMTVEALS